jgi:hypothetical protein
MIKRQDIELDKKGLMAAAETVPGQMIPMAGITVIIRAYLHAATKS